MDNYDFEIEPEPEPVTLPKGGDTSWGGRCQLDITIPIKAAQ